MWMMARMAYPPGGGDLPGWLSRTGALQILQMQVVEHNLQYAAGRSLLPTHECPKRQPPKDRTWLPGAARADMLRNRASTAASGR